MIDCHWHQTQPPTKAIIVHPRFYHTLPDPQPTHPVEDRKRARGAAQLTEPTGWHELPLEVLLHIAAHMTTAKELCMFARISYAASIAARDEVLWKRLCEDTFSVPRDCTPPSWRQLYAFNHQLLRMCLGQHTRTTGYEVGRRGYLRVRVRG